MSDPDSAPQDAPVRSETLPGASVQSQIESGGAVPPPALARQPTVSVPSDVVEANGGPEAVRKMILSVVQQVIPGIGAHVSVAKDDDTLTAEEKAAHEVDAQVEWACKLEKEGAPEEQLEAAHAKLSAMLDKPLPAPLEDALAGNKLQHAVNTAAVAGVTPASRQPVRRPAPQREEEPSRKRARRAPKKMDV